MYFPQSLSFFEIFAALCSRVRCLASILVPQLQNGLNLPGLRFRAVSPAAKYVLARAVICLF